MASSKMVLGLGVVGLGALFLMMGEKKASASPATPNAGPPVPVPPNGKPLSADCVAYSQAFAEAGKALAAAAASGNQATAQALFTQQNGYYQLLQQMGCPPGGAPVMPSIASSGGVAPIGKDPCAVLKASFDAAGNAVKSAKSAQVASQASNQQRAILTQLTAAGCTSGGFLAEIPYGLRPPPAPPSFNVTLCQGLTGQAVAAQKAGATALLTQLNTQLKANGCPTLDVNLEGPAATPGANAFFCLQQTAKITKALAQANAANAAGDSAGANKILATAKGYVTQMKNAGCPTIPALTVIAGKAVAKPAPGAPAAAPCSLLQSAFGTAVMFMRSAINSGNLPLYQTQMGKALVAKQQASSLGCPDLGSIPVLPPGLGGAGASLPPVPSLPPDYVPSGLPAPPAPPAALPSLTTPGSGVAGVPVEMTLRYGDIPTRMSAYYTGTNDRWRELGAQNPQLGVAKTVNKVTNYVGWRPGQVIQIPGSWNPGLKPLVTPLK